MKATAKIRRKALEIIMEAEILVVPDPPFPLPPELGAAG
jgi:hypothetical protein